jgi:hypothetical protein
MLANKNRCATVNHVPAGRRQRYFYYLATAAISTTMLSLEEDFTHFLVEDTYLRHMLFNITLKTLEMMIVKRANHTIRHG